VAAEPKKLSSRAHEVWGRPSILAATASRAGGMCPMHAVRAARRWLRCTSELVARLVTRKCRNISWMQCSRRRINVSIKESKTHRVVKQTVKKTIGPYTA